jgi:hypothetical protein
MVMVMAMGMVKVKVKAMVCERKSARGGGEGM